MGPDRPATREGLRHEHGSGPPQAPHELARLPLIGPQGAGGLVRGARARPGGARATGRFPSTPGGWVGGQVWRTCGPGAGG